MCRLDDVMKACIDKQCMPGARACVFLASIPIRMVSLAATQSRRIGRKSSWRASVGGVVRLSQVRLEIISVRESNRVLRGVDGNQPTVMSVSSRNTDRCPAAQTRGVAGKTVKTWKCLRHQGNSCGGDR